MESLENNRRDFYPEIEAYKTEFLKVSDLHTLYVEQCGNPKGRPVIFLHGGPGGGINSDHRRFFDPEHYRIVLFDQRGSGQSTPAAELRENSTWDLVQDIEKIREHLGIQDWIVFGGSWGSTLALAYAETHPERVKGLILRGIFLCRPSEIKWFYQFGASEIFPDVWESYSEFIPEQERHDFVSAYYKRLTHEDPAIRLEAAKRWSKWEAATSRLIVDLKAVEEFDDPTFALQFARIECHYFTNNAFFETNNFLIENVGKIRHIPAVIVQGRYDVVCPARSAWDLHRAWPEADLHIIPDSGHAAGEAGTRSCLVAMTDKFRQF
ncbi:prolyl aminopeptidase [Pseudobdellovibrio exovorus]|uniref:Proline iminopeptidase n=1 Tax=Pseudobdellovibrio exovorus JSS TaxID=1184267 RepID=M4V5R9_9BACT|nr:prolyl aminopeptidase [Pseudobdellovibrio exovorus]AGH94707.1 proline iminopeptidase [Pseudobdellovibrio exovorus JSS]